MADLCRLTAREAVALLKAGRVSRVELIDAAAARIAATDGAVNALPTLCLDRARARADGIARERTARAGDPAWLAGLPIVVKDLNDVAGVRTTYGSPLFADHIPDGSDAMVETLERNGALVIGKSNTPEFGAGANTFNEVFGKTRNPWNTAMTCGGSSGGAAVAVASGQAWLATGSDFGCSLRTPAAFCGVVGLRPSPGRVARSRTRLPFDDLWVQGPMGRNIGDVALMLDAMSGEDPRDPLSFPAPSTPFQAALERPRAPLRVAYAPDLGGLVPLAKEVRAACDASMRHFTAVGARVEEACPDLSDARDIFHVLRAAYLVGDLGPLIEKHRDRIKPEVIWNYEQGAKLDAGKIAWAQQARGRLFGRIAEFFRTYDLLVSAAAVVPPFDVDIRSVQEVEGRKLETYYDWYLVSYAITVTALPAASVPCGFTPGGLPVGLQVVGRARGEAAVLNACHLFEQAAGIAPQLPIDPRSPAR